MTVILREQNKDLLRFDRGEEVLSILRQYCQDENIGGGIFFGIGAADDVVLSWYNAKEHSYKDRAFQEDLEIASFTGNIAQLNNETVLHAHGSFAGRDFETFAGHVKKLVVSATCEVWIERLTDHVTRQTDKTTGLNLLQSNH